MKQQFGNISVEYKEDDNLVIWSPKGQLNMVDWYQSCDFGFDYFIRLHKEGIKPNWLNDCTEAEYVDMELVKDLQNKNKLLFENIEDAKLAFVMSNYPLFNTAILTYINMTMLHPACNFDIKQFKEIETAYDWLNAKSVCLVV